MKAQTLYLSRLRFGGHGPRNPYDLHRVLWRLFPGMDGEQRPFLFRIERGQGLPTVLMQSSVAPVERAQGVSVLARKAFSLEGISEGQTLRFLLCANPVRRELGTRRRQPLTNAAEQIQWLERQLGEFGQVEGVNVWANEAQRFRKGSHQAVVQMTTFIGSIRVTEAQGLRRRVVDGIGAAKAFGCGMLSLAR